MDALIWCWSAIESGIGQGSEDRMTSSARSG